MKIDKVKVWLQPLRAQLFSPKGLVLRAAALTLLFALCHLAGWREHTSFLSGTAAPESSLEATMIYGLIYIVAYIGLVVLVPVLLLAAGLLGLVQCLLGWRQARADHPASGTSSGSASEVT